MHLFHRALGLAGSAFLLCGTGSAVAAQTAANQPPANYRGPDTYGLCTYVIGDTTYYGNTFFTSSYFKPKAEQAIREYATSQAGGAPTRSRCMWSFKESDLAVMKETDRRLLGLPGHSAQGVETGWTFQGGAPLNGNAASLEAGSPGNATISSLGQGSTALAPSSGASLGAGTPATALPAPVATNVAASPTIRNVKGSTTGALVTGSKQSIANAKTGAVANAGNAITNGTNTALNSLSGGVSGVFHRKPAAPSKPAQSETGTLEPAGGGAQANSVPSSAPGGSLGFDESAAAVAAASNAGVATSAAPSGTATSSAAGVTAANAVEGLVADVSGKDVIINVGGSAGVRTGATLSVVHPRVVKDPVTGKPLRTVENQVGELQITSVEASSASGVFHGAGVPAVGDKVRTKP